MGYINVVIDNKSKAVDRFFTYKCEEMVSVGQRVKVPFGGNKTKSGFVVETGVEPKIDESKIKAVSSIDPVAINEEMVKTAIWMHSRYGIRYYDAINCFFTKDSKVIEDENKNVLKDYIKRLEKKENKGKVVLTDEQENAVSLINVSIERGQKDIFLIEGVTSSGKTLVYLEACEKALQMGKTAIMLVPEIALTGQTVERFIERFGEDKVALLHSKLTIKERYDQWVKLRNGTAKIAIGARIGVFAPLENIGLIILDEEHESTYKADQSPKYDTVDVALKRLIHYNGVLLLGSATPSVVSYQRVKEGIYKHIKLTKRYNNTLLPTIDVVQMRDEVSAGNLSILSRPLRKKLDECLADGKQAILFLNRRGYSNYVSCRGCGETLKCQDCNITTTYHKAENKLICHYCGKKYDVPKQCPECGSKYIKHIGIGTEQVEETLRSEYPDRAIDRLDIDTGKNRRQIEAILSKFKKGKTDILVGTQLVAKGLDFDNVGVVGILSVDSILNLPDYRASERAYQLITQVAGRAGRGQERGQVIIQTFEPDSYPIRFASKYSFEDFFKKEISIRKTLEYPPFSDLIVVFFTHKDKNVAIKTGKEFLQYAKKLDSGILADRAFDLKEAITFKGNGSYRAYTIIKCPKGYRNKLMFSIDQFKDQLIEKRNDVNIIIDVNPYSIF